LIDYQPAFIFVRPAYLEGNERVLQCHCLHCKFSKALLKENFDYIPYWCQNDSRFPKSNLENDIAIQFILLNYNVSNLLWFVPRYFMKFLEMFEIQQALSDVSREEFSSEDTYPNSYPYSASREECDGHELYYCEDSNRILCECGNRTEDCCCNVPINFIYLEASCDYNPMYIEIEIFKRVIEPPVVYEIENFNELRNLISLCDIRGFEQLQTISLEKKYFISRMSIYMHNCSGQIIKLCVLPIHIREFCIGYKRALDIMKFDVVSGIQCKIKNNLELPISLIH